MFFSLTFVPELRGRASGSSVLWRIYKCTSSHLHPTFLPATDLSKQTRHFYRRRKHNIDTVGYANVLYIRTYLHACFMYTYIVACKYVCMHVDIHLYSIILYWKKVSEHIIANCLIPDYWYKKEKKVLNPGVELKVFRSSV